MEKKTTLEVIQIFAKIGRIVSKVVEIACFVGAICCLVGLIVMAAVPTMTIQLDHVTIHNIIESSAGMTVGKMYTFLLVGLFACVGEVIVARFAGRYFKNELAAGTPFTLDGAKELLKLGIITIVVPICTSIACGITVGIASVMQVPFESIDIDFGGSVVIGIIFIVLSFICKYGAEQKAESSKTMAS